MIAYSVNKINADNHFSNSNNDVKKRFIFAQLISKKKKTVHQTEAMGPKKYADKFHHTVTTANFFFVYA